MLKKIDRLLCWLARILFGGLVVFELLNRFKILHAELSFTWDGLLLTVGVVWLLVEGLSFFLKRKTNQPLFGWSKLAAALAVYVDAVGDIALGYAKYGWYDQAAHLIGGGAVGGLIFVFLRLLVEKRVIRIGGVALLIFSVGLAGFLGSIYEMEEYLEDYFTGSHRLGDGFDTANDMMLNTLGAVFVVSLALAFKKKAQEEHK